MHYRKPRRPLAGERPNAGAGPGEWRGRPWHRGRSPPGRASAPACVEVEGYFKSKHVKRLSLNLRGAVFRQLHVF